MSTGGGLCGPQDDPFYWSPERLVQELCTANRSWEAPPARKWPNPDCLAARLREHDMDGEDLVTYQDLAGHYAFDSLCRDLGIVKIPHKASLLSAIQVFQFRSPGYHAWKSALLRRRREEAASFASELQLQPGQYSTTSGAVVATDAGVTATVHATGTSRATTSQPSKKRKRTAPINISTTPQSRPISTPYGGTVALTARGTVDNSERMWRESSDGAFFGPWRLSNDDMLYIGDPLDTPDGERPAIADFAWVSPRPFPVGRQLQVHQTVRRFLQPRRSTLNLGRTRPQRLRPPGLDRRPVGTVRVNGALAEKDVVLPLLGESDDDEEYDTETWEAIQEEEEERRNPPVRRNAPLSAEDVEAVVGDAVRDMETQWAQAKLPGLRHREHALWSAARRAGACRYKAGRAYTRAQELGRRIDRLIREMRLGEYKTEAELRRQTTSLDASIVDRQRALWEARLYSAPAEPLKPTQGAPRPRRRTVRTLMSDSGEDIITSSEDEDDFFVRDNDDSDGDGDDDDGDDDDDEDYAGRDYGDITMADRAETNSVGLPEPTPDKAEAMVAPPAFVTDALLEDAPAIAAKGPKHGEDRVDIRQLLLALFFSHDRNQLDRLFGYMHLDDETAWQTYVVATLALTSPKVQTYEDDATAFCRFFCIFLKHCNVSAREFVPIKEDIRSRILANRNRLGSFCVLARSLLLHGLAPVQSTGKGTETADGGAEASRSGEEADQSDMAMDTEPSTDIEVVAAQPVRIDEGVDTEADEDEDGGGDDIDNNNDDDSNSADSSSRVQTEKPKQRRRLIRDQDAQSLRDRDRARLEAQESRRKVLIKQLAQSREMPEDQSRLIINTAKEEQYGLVYVNATIATQIRGHQIEGVRFMWNQLVVPAKVRQGCLLAHTMGLGKTMQVITLLVAVAEAAASTDATVSAQIPDDLRQSKTLILCPSGLVQNWLDELARWTPGNMLGTYRYLAADMALPERFAEVEAWAERGGVLVIGYPMFRRLLVDFGDDIRPLLEKSAHVVIADEAHALKNPKSKVHDAAAHFSAKARIAMTGSPLANAVEEYHAMINWAAPNYLANHREFVTVYANPIKEGFYSDSTPQQKRRAIKLLKVLKDTVAPKIHRATVASLKGELPPKTELILYLPLTELQMTVYRTFLELVQSSMVDDIRNTVQLWNILFNLTLLLAHPKVFYMRLKEMEAALAAGGNDSSGGARRTGSWPGHGSLPGLEPWFGARAGVLPAPAVEKLLALVKRPDLDGQRHSPKIVVLMGILDEARRLGDKVLVFSQSKLVLDYLDELLRRQKRPFSRLDGDTSTSLRQSLVNDFNNGADEVYLISTTAGGVGLNIQGANRVVIFDFKWNPMHEQQAIGRAYRIGQTKPVFVYWLITDGTCETVLHNQAVFKTQLASRVIDKKNPHAWAKQVRDYTAEPTIAPQAPDLAALFTGRDRVLDALLADTNRCSRIGKIVSTDTFEEEEPEHMLSAEELKEAANLVLLNKARSQNPWNFAVAAAAAAALQAIQSPPMVSTVPVSPVSVSTVPTVQQAVPTATGPTAKPPPPLQISRDSPQATAQPDSHNPPQLLLASSLPHVASSPLCGFPYELERILRDHLMFDDVHKMGYKRAKWTAQQLVAGIKKCLPITGVPATAHWARLRNRMLDDDVFTNAVISGRVSAEVLATMTSREEDALVAELHQETHDTDNNLSQEAPATRTKIPATSLAQEQIPATLAVRTPVSAALVAHKLVSAAPVRAEDPDHVTEHLQRSLDRLLESRGHAGKTQHKSGDMVAMEELLQQRRQRQERKEKGQEQKKQPQQEKELKQREQEQEKQQQQGGKQQYLKQNKEEQSELQQEQQQPAETYSSTSRSAESASARTTSTQHGHARLGSSPPTASSSPDSSRQESHRGHLRVSSSGNLPLPKMKYRARPTPSAPVESPPVHGKRPKTGDTVLDPYVLD